MSFGAILGVATGGASLGVNSGNEQVDQLAGNLLSNLQNTIIGGITNNLGAVFANGLDFSCWGSATNPTKEKQKAQQEFQDKLNHTKVLSNPSSATLTELSKSVQIHVNSLMKLVNNKKYSSCSRKGWKARADYFTANMQTIIDNFNASGFAVSENGTANVNADGGVTTYKVYTVTRTQTASPIVGGVGSGDFDLSPSQDVLPVSQKSDGISPLWLALGSFLLLRS